MKHPNACGLVVAGLLLVGGCSDGFEWPWKMDGQSADASTADVELTAEQLLYRGTVGEVAAYEGLRKMRVQGYGLVGGLGKNGSVECPRDVRDRLVSELSKRPEFQAASLRRKGITPARVIDGPDTAVVLVQGEIPAGAVRGTQFDISVSAMPGTQTSSLRGGQLLGCEMHIVRMVTPSAGIAGRALAEAEGPVFMNPFSDEPDAATRTAELFGTVIGGGTVLEDRRLRIVLFQPSYSVATRVAAAINARFSQPRKTADAVSPSYINLRIPPEYLDDPAHFLAVVRHLPVTRGPAEATRRARALRDAMLKPNAPHASIALGFEALGEKIIPEISLLYGHENAYVRYYAALAGLRLEDDVAVDAIADHAMDPDSPMRFAAIEELGAASTIPRATRPLQKLLDDSDGFVRVAAYEALMNWGGTGIRSFPIGGDNFYLDLVPSDGTRLVYAKRTGERRIALFGDGLQCLPPLVYRSPDGGLLINADADDSHLTIIRRMPYDRLSRDPISADLDLAPLLRLLGDDPSRIPGRREGLSVGYGTLIQFLNEMHEMRAMNAVFMLEQKSIKELFGPDLTPGRPESEFE